ncbi:MAG: putative toxin-antitoxin system toxin component, PIN family [Kiritimatiellae bacterium]|nr:putative toxin-antitoxin system toxin component, PIN family [Kiritimatiellia bacterium]MCO5062670.1 putative toxin-antitoxin system toxin component, PIN family [Kiritimatiellia bacterium]
MRVVLDANVLIAAFAARGLCEAILALCLANDDLFVTSGILADVRSKLSRKLRMPTGQVDDIVTFLLSYCQVIDPAGVPQGTCRDSDDHDVLGAAAAAQADFLITGNEDLIVLKKYRRTRIVTPRQYWEDFSKRRT